MTVLRVGAPNGEIVIEGDAIQNRQMFEMFARFGWLVEERHKRDRIESRTRSGWRGEPVRRANVEQ